MAVATTTAMIPPIGNSHTTSPPIQLDELSAIAATS